MPNHAFTPFPILVTERLTLRQLSLDDAQNIYALRSNSEINKYLARQPCKSIEDATKFIQQITENINKNESLYWVITLNEGAVFVGTICLFDFSVELNKCEIGYELLPDFQGKGTMYEAVNKVMEYAFQSLKIQNIEAFTHKNNLKSTKLLEKIEYHKSIGLDVTYADCLVFSYSNTKVIVTSILTDLLPKKTLSIL
jgi:[ribosomal protein S5]-alanine N-acetyltransferase